MQFGTFFMTKAKQGKMKCLFLFYPFNFKSESQRKLVSKVATTTEFLVIKERMLVALATVSVAILSPEYQSETSFYDTTMAMQQGQKIGFTSKTTAQHVHYIFQFTSLTFTKLPTATLHGECEHMTTYWEILPKYDRLKEAKQTW